MERDNTRMPSTLSYSLVYGYTPRALRKDYPFWDWRIFGELTGERDSRTLMEGIPLPGTQAHQIFKGRQRWESTEPSRSQGAYSSRFTEMSAFCCHASASGSQSTSRIFFSNMDNTEEQQ